MLNIKLILILYLLSYSTKCESRTFIKAWRAKQRSRQMVIGVTWCSTEESWAKVKASATDPEAFEATFDQWKAMAVAARRNFQRSGVMALECLIDPVNPASQ